MIAAARDLHNLLVHQFLDQRRRELPLTVQAYAQLPRVVLAPGVKLPIGNGYGVVVAAADLGALQVGDLLGRAQEVFTDDETQLPAVIAAEAEDFAGGGGDHWVVLAAADGDDALGGQGLQESRHVAI